MSYQQSLDAVFREASELASLAGNPCSTGHLVVALLAQPGPARQLLWERGLDQAAALEQLQGLPGDADFDPVTKTLRKRCLSLATGSKLQAPVGLHLLIALANLQNTTAFALLGAFGVDQASLRMVALALATSGASAGSRRVGAQGVASAAAPEISSRGGEDVGALRPAAQPWDHLAPKSPRGRRDRTHKDPRVTKRTSRARSRAVEIPEAFRIDEKLLPTISALGRNLSAAASLGQVERLLGRRRVVQQVLDVLGKRRANNPCLVGEPGVGKTAIVEGLAYLQVHEPEAVPLLANRCVVALNMGALLSGTQLRGAFSERMAALRAEMETAEGKVVLFLDEIHTLVGAGASGDGALDAVSELSAAMADGRFPCIGATTTEKYRRFVEQTPALQRRLQPILVPEPSIAETLEILRGVAPQYATHHRIQYLEESFSAAARLSQRFISDRFLPDKAISLLDLAGSRARQTQKNTVAAAAVAELVAEETEVPVERLLMTDTDRFRHMESRLGERVIGHQQIIGRAAQVVRRNYAGFASDRPIGSFLLLGPTGVGKTEFAKALADFLFQSRAALCRLDMSEFMEPHSVARLIGSPPGYVGYDHGGQLTEAIRRRPYQLVLLDEVEKAHRDVLQVLLQLLDEGRLTDGRGRTVDFSHTVVIMTSNLGSEHYARETRIGFGADPSAAASTWTHVEQEVLRTAKRAFPLELWNRIEERLVFEPLERDQLLGIARLLVRDSSRRLAAERQISFEASASALEHLIEHGGYEPSLGARPMRNTIQRLVETAIAEQILVGAVDPGSHLLVDECDGALVIGQAEQAAGQPDDASADSDAANSDAAGAHEDDSGEGSPPAGESLLRLA